MKQIKISTGIYQTSDYHVIAIYSSKKYALKFLKTIGYAHNEIFNTVWTNQGKKYTLTIN